MTHCLPVNACVSHDPLRSAGRNAAAAACCVRTVYLQVRCQATGMPMGVVIRQLMASPATTVAQLYAGVVSASVASVAVGE
jgi:hypothetical protein